MKKVIVLLVTSVFFAAFNHAETALAGSKTISLIDQDNQRLRIGEIQFISRNGKLNYEINLNGKEFRDEFLSMRPFKCFRFTDKMICHLPYPYTKSSSITENDLVNLEYDLLFLHKSPGEYGINAWNGLYYDLQMRDEQIQGFVKEVDLNILSAPPEPGVLQPITEDMLYDVDEKKHLFPRLLIH